MKCFKKRLFSIVLFTYTICLNSIAQQADIPTIIVFPDDTWMLEHEFMEKIENGGEATYIPKHEEALMRDREMATSIQAVQKVLQERTYTFL